MVIVATLTGGCNTVLAACMLFLDHHMCHSGYSTWCHHSLLLVLDMQGCSTGKKGVVYDFFFQYGPSVQLTNSDYWLNFDSGFDSSITGRSPSVCCFVLCVCQHVHAVWSCTAVVQTFQF